MNILVTGATGFLGGAVVARLLAQGHEVTALGRNEQQGRRLQLAGAQFVQVDLADQQKMVACCAGQQVVFHCGALSSPWGSYRDFHRSNVLGTSYVLEGCQRHQVERLVYVSTPSLYFRFRDQLLITEQTPLSTTPINGYIGSKYLADQLVQQQAEAGIPVISIRPRALYGPGDQAIVPRLLRANRHGALPLFREGRIWTDLTYIDHCVDALLLCMKAPDTYVGRVYNITDGSPALFIELLEHLFAALKMNMNTKKLPLLPMLGLAYAFEGVSQLFTRGKWEPLFTRYTLGTLAYHQTLSIEAARRDLGYEPRFSTQEGLVRVAEWLRESGELAR